jgi:DNA-binding protein Fis
VKEPPDASELPAELLLPLAEVERRHCLAVLEICEHNQTEAARVLGIDRKTLRRRLFDYGVTAHPRRPRR